MKRRAKFSNKTKEAIYERDGKSCIICGRNTDLQFHHVFYGSESNYGDDRNSITQGVTTCAMDHIRAHSCKKGKGIRQEMIDYLFLHYQDD